jgi:hypothetical protein
MAINCNKKINPETFKNAKIDWHFLFCKYTIWQPWLNRSAYVPGSRKNRIGSEMASKFFLVVAQKPIRPGADFMNQFRL